MSSFGCSGALQLRLDDFAVTAATSDLHRESADESTGDHYLLRISGGAARVSLETDPAIIVADGGGRAVADAVDAAGSEAADTLALDLVLDGVASRAAAPRPGPATTAPAAS